MTTLWMDLALAYAKARWCWDDIVFLAEALADADGRVRPDDAVDALAQKYDLDDPLEPWNDYVNKDLLSALRARISTFMMRHVH